MFEVLIAPLILLVGILMLVGSLFAVSSLLEPESKQMVGWIYKAQAYSFVVFIAAVVLIAFV